MSVELKAYFNSAGTDRPAAFLALATENGLDGHRWDHLNPGMRRMNIGNCLRGMHNNGSDVKIGGISLHEAPMIAHHTALIYTMVLVSAADGDMTDAELAMIGGITRSLPVFKDFDTDKLTQTAADCAALLNADEGFETVLGLIGRALPEPLRETAYVLACDVAAADSVIPQEELRLLEMLRNHLKIQRLSATAIECAARARYATA